VAFVVLTGGARSGKSAAAQALAQVRSADGVPVVIAVFGADDGDPEFALRVARHRAERPDAWETIEAAAALAWFADVPEGALLLVDCLGTLVGRCMAEAWDEVASGPDFRDAEDLPPGYEAACDARVDAVVAALLGREGDTVVVTNEVGDGIVPAYATGRLFRDLLGRANRRVVEHADAAYLCVAGRLVDLTALPRQAHWPSD